MAVAKLLDNSPDDNPLTDAGATLGRVLFYDRTLSANQSTSCASCHRQENAFAEPLRVSVGFDGRKVSRNSMPLFNLRYAVSRKFFWDHRAATLEQQVLMPIQNEIEMGHQLPELVEQLANDPIYPPLFHAAFGDAKITDHRIARALAQFVRSIDSFRSRYDVGRAQVSEVTDPFPNFSRQENLGKEQFFGRALCSQCHLPSLNDNQPQSAFFQLAKATVNGIDHEDGSDIGIAAHTKVASDVGRFKSSSLRNIELTAPYMHDGRFGTLDEVIEHYNWSVKPHPNLDPLLEDFAANGLALPEVEKVALAKFLLTLTDKELIQDPRYADPFLPATERRNDR